MDLLNVLWSFLGTSAALALGGLALKKLSSWFVEHRLQVALKDHEHALGTKLARLEADLGRVTDVISRRNEREFLVVETAWDLMIRAVGDAQGKFGSMHWGPPDFTKMTEAQSERAVESTPFSPDEKKVLLALDPFARVDAFRRIMYAYDTRAARNAWGAFKNHLSTRQIFISPTIHAQFVTVENELSSIIALAESYTEMDMDIPTKERIEINVNLQAITRTIDALGAGIRKRFGFEEEDGQR